MSDTTHLFAVRKKIATEIRKLEIDQEEISESTSRWKKLQQQIEQKRKQLWRLEFMIYNGGEQCG